MKLILNLFIVWKFFKWCTKLYKYVQFWNKNWNFLIACSPWVVTSSWLLGLRLWTNYSIAVTIDHCWECFIATQRYDKWILWILGRWLSRRWRLRTCLNWWRGRRSFWNNLWSSVCDGNEWCGNGHNQNS